MDLHENGWSVKDKVCLVTGATSGVGKGMALGLAQAGTRLVLLVRNFQRGGAVREEIFKRTGNSQVELLMCDLSLRSSITEAVGEFKKKFNHLHLLSNNAGGIFYHRQETGEGIEKTWAMDVMSHLHLTHSLLDLLRADAPARIITVAGGPIILKRTRMNWQDLQFGKDYYPFAAAAQAALARVLWTHKLATSLQRSGVLSFSFFPGLIRTRMDRHLPWYLRFPVRLANPFFGKIPKTGLYLATTPGLENLSGKYFVRKRVRDIFAPEILNQLIDELWLKISAPF